MKPETIVRSELHQKLAQGATAVTGNARLAAALQQEFQRLAVDNGQQVWESPAIKPWNSWLEESWHEAVFDGLIESPALLLTDIQELYVWESVIDSSEEIILRKEATAKKAREAWRQLVNWQVRHDEIDFDINEDTRVFQLWADQFEQRCKEQDWLPASRMAEQLLHCFSNDAYTFDAQFEKEILFVGFDELTPLQQSLFAAIRNAGGMVRWFQLESSSENNDKRPRTAVRLACTDNDDEIITLARWIRRRLQQKPETRIGVVAPDLAAHRSSLIRRFTEILVPANLQTEGDEPQPWNISLGLPLKHYPVIETAFSVLQLAGGKFALEDIGPLLNSPYLQGASEELGARSLLDRKLRDIGEQHVSLAALSRHAGNSEQACHSPLLAEQVSRLAELNEKIPGSAHSADWVKWFSQILSTLGWAKDRDFSAEEYQSLEAWNKVLARFSGLQAVSGRMSYSHALGLLKRVAQSQIFQPRTEDAPVQVLGLYEAIGQQFDALWVLDLHDSNWPPSPQPNPFIALSMQRRLVMPHADQAREFSIARGITDRLLSAALDVVMSYPLRKGEESLRPSPLISELHEGQKEEMALSDEQTWSEKMQQSARLELVRDDMAPPLQQERASGGSGIFKYQSLCPFRAFAQYRLSATALATPQTGLDAMKRGQLFHAVLELFWRHVSDHRSLAAMSSDQLEQLLETVIGQAIDQMAENNPGIFTPRFRQLESARLIMLSQQWLAIEKQRPDFKVVSFEKETWQEVNGINVHLWIDRIDELADGRKVVIDYKTGSVSPSQWFGERPEEPQLPLYSMVEGEGICAVLFGQLKASDMKFSGVVEQEGLIPGLPPPRNQKLKEITEQWPQVLDDWKLTIDQLADDFRNGKADVMPKNINTCETSYCELSGLCRINESIAGAEDD